MRAPAAALAAAVLVLALSASFARWAPIDDAFISLRYADHLRAGEGLVFNPEERVEGYTNLLWVLLLAVMRWTGTSGEDAMRLLGTGFSVATVALLAWAWRGRRGAAAWAGPGAAIALALDPVWSLWAVHGLETAAFGCLVTVATLVDGGDAGRSGRTLLSPLLWAAATWTRPEGALLFLVSTALAVMATPRGSRVRACVGRLTPYLVVCGGWELWRLAYYGAPLPNTYYAKAGLTAESLLRGARYVAAFAGRTGALAIIAAAAVGALRGGRPERHLAAVIAAGAVAVVAEGGDAFPAFRFLAPLLPLLCLLAASGVGTIVLHLALRGRRGTAALVLAAAAALLGVHVAQQARPAHQEALGGDRFTRTMQRVGLTLRRALPPGTWIALNPAGAVPYASGLPAIDMLGLTDAHIARTRPHDLGTGQAGHEKGDGDYVLARRPEIILLGNVLTLAELPGPGFVWPVAHRSEREIVSRPEFRRDYAPAALPLDGGGWVLFYRRRDAVLPGIGWPNRPRPGW